MSSIYFVADFFAEEVLGGGELNNEEFINLARMAGFTVSKIKSTELTKEQINSGFVIVANFIGLSEDRKEDLKNSGNYLIYEHDHKYLTTRDPSGFKNYIAPQEFLCNIEFYEKAKAVLCQSSLHSTIVKSNIPEANVENLSGNLWGLDTLRFISSQNKKDKKDKKDKDKRQDKTNKKSVLISDHPVFSRIKGELPSRNKQKHASRNPWIQRYFGLDVRYQISSKLVILGAAIFLSFFIYREITDPFLDYREGQIAQRHLIAQSTIEFEDETTSEEKRRDAVSSVLPVYDYDHRVIVRSIQNLRTAFRKLRSAYSDVWKGKKTLLKESNLFIKSKKLFSQTLEVEVTDEEFLALVSLKFSNNLERTLIHLFVPVESKLIVLSKELLNSGQDRGITMNHLNEPFVEPREEIYKNLVEIVDIKDARKRFIKSGKRVFLSNRREFELTALNVVSRLLIPNLTFNKQETERRNQAVADDIQPVIIKINKGDTIIRYGDPITKRHLTILSYLERLRAEESSHFRFLFTTVLLTILLYLLFTFQRGGFEPYRYSLKDVAVLMSKIAELQQKQDTNLKKIIVIEGVEYGFHPDLDSITLGEYADIETFIKNGVENHLAELMAVLYRPIKEKKNDIYIIDAYDGNIRLRAEEMKKMSAQQVQSALVFFYNLGKELSMILPLYLMERLTEMQTQ